MILSFEGRTMAEIEDEVRAFLRSETAEAAVPPAPAEQPAPEPPFVPDPPKPSESRYTAADVRQALAALAKTGVPRDEIREAMKRICGADRVSDIPTERYEAIMSWSAGRAGSTCCRAKQDDLTEHKSDSVKSPIAL